MRGQVGDTADSIALHLDVGRHHLSDQRSQPSKLDNQDFVFGYDSCQLQPKKCTFIWRHTVDGKIPQRGTSSSLYFDVGVLEKKENRLEGVPVNRPYIYAFELASLPHDISCRTSPTALCNLGERQTRTSLEVDVF